MFAWHRGVFLRHATSKSGGIIRKGLIGGDKNQQSSGNHPNGQITPAARLDRRIRKSVRSGTAAWVNKHKSENLAAAKKDLTKYCFIYKTIQARPDLARQYASKSTKIREKLQKGRSKKTLQLNKVRKVRTLVHFTEVNR